MMKYMFVDGAGSKYILEKGILSYHPMKPENSSSGIYDGGTPQSIKVSKLAMIKFVDVIERSIWATDDHSEIRSMGSGTIVKTLDGSISTFYLRRNSKSMLEVESVLKNILN